MAGTVTATEVTHTGIKKVTFAWTSDAAGAADGTTTGYYTGQILRMVAAPGAGVDQPTDLYDVVVNDADGTDVLMGAGPTGVTPAQSRCWRPAGAAWWPANSPWP